MNFAAIKPCDIANGPGVRVSLFVSGCTHHCPGCFQPETWDFNYGQPFTEEVKDKILSLLQPDYIQGLTLLGGEPFEPDNQAVLVQLTAAVRDCFPEKTIWGFTGFTLSQLQARTGDVGDVTRLLLSHLHILVDGPFIEAKKNLALRFRGSENQRLIDLSRSREEKKLVLLDDGI